MSGTLSLVLGQARLSLADSATFRALCGVADRAGALGHCYLRNLPEPADGADTYSREELEWLRPYALFFLPDREALTLTPAAVGAHREYNARGKLTVRISRAVPEDKTRDEADTDWDDIVWGIIEEVTERSGDGSDSYLCFESLSIVGGPGRHHASYDPAQGEEQGVDLEIVWGGQEGAG